MRDFRDAKAVAQTLRDQLKAKGIILTHSDSLELTARAFGFHDWNTLAAKIQCERKPPEAERPAGKTSRQEFIDLFRRRLARPEIALDASILDGYTGYYKAPQLPRLHDYARREPIAHASYRTTMPGSILSRERHRVLRQNH